MGVSVLGGGFVERLRKREAKTGERLSEEEFPSEQIFRGKGDTEKKWRKRLKEAKTRLLAQLDYSGCNAWLGDTKFFAEQMIVDTKRQEEATRLVYLAISFFLVGLDFIFKDISFLEPSVRDRELIDGFRHGSLGGEKAKRIVQMAKKLVTAYAPDGSNVAAAMEKNVATTFEEIPAEVLQEFFSKPENTKCLFANAKAFEGHAFARQLVVPEKLEEELQAILGVELDFIEVERRKFFGSFAMGKQESLPMGATTGDEGAAR